MRLSVLAVAILLAACGRNAEAPASGEKKPPAPAARQAPAPAPQADDLAPPDWPRFLPGLLPGIDGCLASAEAGSLVALAMPMNHGKALVRLLSPAHLRAECIVDLGARKVREMNSLAPNAASLPGENSPVFLRAPGIDYSVEGVGLPATTVPPGRLRELRGGDGVLWGWIVADPLQNGAASPCRPPRC